MSDTFWKVAVDAPVTSLLTYSVPKDWDESQIARLCRGMSVLIPLGNRKCSGVLMSTTADPGTFAIKDLADLRLERPILAQAFMQWLEWLSQYYVHPIGQVVHLAFPPLMKSEKRRKSSRAPVVPELGRSEPPVLSTEQAGCLRQIQDSQGFQVHLLHGVTGSGKTEVYIRLLEDLVKIGKKGIVLVPEISLTPQLIQRFSRRLGDSIAVIHSHLTPREKTNQWWAMVEGKKQVLIGARSALFCPIENLGMIIVDEEHEASFKQDEKLKYHARDAAVMLAKFCACPVVLGSATPSLESWRNAQLGRYRLHEMRSRVENRSLPDIQIVDMRQERERRRQGDETSEVPFWMSDTLHEALVVNHSKRLQSALFLNRRGVAQTVLCASCGFVPECPNCAVSLTLHGKNHLVCHYCDFHKTMRETCSECREGEPRPMGIGTELIERDLTRLFPSARVARLDRDEVGTREDLERIIAEVENREVDFIVGTQMIAKGLDFPGLTVVGLVLADIGFNLPDFRAGERSFQLLTQVSGRSGRHLTDSAGLVVIQTYNPDHSSIQFTKVHDFAGFSKFELGFREALRYPPAWRLASFRIQGMDQGMAWQAARDLGCNARDLQKRVSAFAGIEILGPAQAPLAKLRNQYRFQLLIKAPESSLLVNFCRTLVGDAKRVPPRVRIVVDIDAINLM